MRKIQAVGTRGCRRMPRVGGPKAESFCAAAGPRSRRARTRNLLDAREPSLIDQGVVAAESELARELTQTV